MLKPSLADFMILRRTKLLRRTRLSPMSPRRKHELHKYAMLRKDFLKQNPVCEAGPVIVLNGGPDCCTKKALHVHHSHKRGKRLNWVETWIPCCPACHQFIEDHKGFAREAGLLVNLSEL